MSVSKWAYDPDVCDGDFCVGDCDLCPKAEENVARRDSMNDLIRRSDVERWILTESACIDTPADRDAVVDRMRYSIPAVDAVEVRHGRFLESEDTISGWRTSNYVCSVCKEAVATWRKGLAPEQMYRYCPWCGARMDGQRREDGDA